MTVPKSRETSVVHVYIYAATQGMRDYHRVGRLFFFGDGADTPISPIQK